VSGFRDRIKPRMQDWMMGFMNGLRSETVEKLSGDVLEVGFGTGLNLAHCPPGVTQLTGLDPLVTDSIGDRLSERIAAVPFPVERAQLPADGELPFEDASFDCVMTTWTLCSIEDPEAALAEMRRVLRPGGRYVFIEHGRSDDARTAGWQDRINPYWQRFADGCNINRPIDRLVAGMGFELLEMNRFRHKGPSIVAQMYRGVATRSDTAGD
jgi:ubiquinone/menaquinone biosynthesis C-methylase UbiE